MKTMQKNAFTNRQHAAPKRRSQQGFTIMGALLTLVIGAIVAAGIFIAYNDSQRKTRVDAASSEIAAMIADAQKVYGHTGQYGAVTTAIAVQGGIIPARLRITGTNTAQNRYNGSVTFAPATITSANDSLTLGYNNVSSSDCQDLVFSVEPLTRRILVAGETVKAADATVNLATLSTACDSDDRVDLQFTVGRH